MCEHLAGTASCHLLTSLALIPCWARNLPGRAAPQGREHIVQLRRIFKCGLKFNIPGMLFRKSSFLKESHARLIWLHIGTCHVSELNQTPWPLIIEPITNVPTKTPIYRHTVGQSLLTWLTRNPRNSIEDGDEVNESKHLSWD